VNVALAGLPASGKTCLFDALSEGAVDSSSHPARSDHPNRASVAVPDERLQWLAELYGAPKQTRVHMEFLDVPGLAPGRPELTAQNTAILDHLRRADALVYVLRAFASDRVPHLLGRVDPRGDRDVLFSEFALADLDVTVRRMEKLEKQIQKPTPERDAHRRELEVLARCREALENEKPLHGAIQSEADRAMLRGFAFLTEKPVLAVLNVAEDKAGNPEAVAAEYADLGLPLRALSASLEAEIGALAPQERQAFLEELGLKRFHTPEVIRGVCEALDRITFFTCGSNEVAARSVPRGTTAVQAAGEVHTDMARGFIRAEVVTYADLRRAGSIKQARADGHFLVEGRDFVVREGDVIHFHFSR
jgi:GTP-binding protein YchF